MITLIPYSSNWPLLFEEEKNQLLDLGVNNIVAIEHIGSTAIPGIHAKPVIDILVGVRNLSEFTDKNISEVESLGYRYNPKFETVLPNRRYFQKEDLKDVRTHQIHLLQYPSPWSEQQILFRNYLRSYANSAREYEELKFSLAQRFDNTIDYANGKNDFCHKILRLAFNDPNINKPFLETNNLVAFIPQIVSHPDYAHMLANPEFIENYGVAYNEAQALQRLQSDIEHYNQFGFAPWEWYKKNTNAYVGRGGFKRFTLNDRREVELTYQIQRKFWNRGFASEIGLSAIDFALNTMKWNDIVCFATCDNLASLHVMQKLGFSFEGDFIHAGITHKLHRLVSKSHS
jgi:GrpB-like predicted nucleotidyltransferase (UPF0157 family)/predicted acetyltransferase